MSSIRVLIVCESFDSKYSGGRVARFLSELLKKCEVAQSVIALNESESQDARAEPDGVSAQQLRLDKSWSSRLRRAYGRSRELAIYRDSIEAFRPDIVHFASFDIDKPSRFISLARECGAKVVLQPWTHRFYCYQGFAFRNGGVCTQCSSGRFYKALSNGCTNLRGLPLQYERRLLRKRAMSADLVLSSSSEMDAILDSYGFPQEQIERFVVPFQATVLAQSQPTDGDYFIYYGQALDYKGIHLLLDVFGLLPDVPLIICPFAPYSLPSGLGKNIKVINNLSWKTGLEALIRDAKAVVVPSLWSTTTEYSLCEAMALAKPVVAFNIGVHRDILKNEINALLAEPLDVAQFRNNVLRLSGNRDLRLRLGMEARRSILELNDVNSLSRQLRAIYKKALAS